MHIFTFQIPGVRVALESTGQYVNRASNASSKWMAAAMRLRGFHLESDAPVWAWYASVPQDNTVVMGIGRSLLSDAQLDDGIELLELEVPETQVLLSHYDVWNFILDEYLDRNRPVPKQVVETLFRVDAKSKSTVVWQACLPSVQREWMRRFRSFTL